MKKLYLVLALLFALSACSVGKKCAVTDEGNIVDTDHSEIPHEHKCAHILALENGNYAAQPNNRLIWNVPSFTVKDEVPTDWKVQTSDWTVENSRRWKTEDSDKFFYGIEENKDD